MRPGNSGRKVTSVRFRRACAPHGAYAMDPSACLQGDYDSDGVGDACDAHPFRAQDVAAPDGSEGIADVEIWVED